MADEVSAMHDRIRLLTRTLLLAGPEFQGGNGIVGLDIANALGIEHPIRMKALVPLAVRLGFDPIELWPWSRTANGFQP